VSSSLKRERKKGGGRIVWALTVQGSHCLFDTSGKRWGVNDPEETLLFYNEVKDNSQTLSSDQ